MEAPGINFSTAPASTGNCHIRALSLCVLILGAAPVHLLLGHTSSGARSGPRRRRQTSARRGADDATFSLAQAEVPRGRRSGVVVVGSGGGTRVALRQPIVQAPHTRRRTAAPARDDDDDDGHCVLVILVILANTRIGPPGHSDALAFVGHDHVTRYAACAVRGFEFGIAPSDAAAAAQSQIDVYERGGYTAVGGASIARDCVEFFSFVFPCRSFFGLRSP